MSSSFVDSRFISFLDLIPLFPPLPHRRKYFHLGNLWIHRRLSSRQFNYRLDKRGILQMLSLSNLSRLYLLLASKSLYLRSVRYDDSQASIFTDSLHQRLLTVGDRSQIALVSGVNWIEKYWSSLLDFDHRSKECVKFSSLFQSFPLCLTGANQSPAGSEGLIQCTPSFITEVSVPTAREDETVRYITNHEENVESSIIGTVCQTGKPGKKIVLRARIKIGNMRCIGWGILQVYSP
ncbi:hypothetical protein ARMSODRAFT_969292 [Armillaria solidipes]|uniref:PLD phosphodiesterase domain-containing protein n=1 Tax=Armillaria solidipes TaxID=1076256 RepID=A0A2H3C0K1_9AGAR|nr:hypothetical protein ARMSODRAFT_969292 [Armillaria solidipes]